MTITSLKTGKRDRAAIVECAYELRHYLVVAEDVKVEQVHMLCPPALTGKIGWTLEHLLDIVFHQGTEINDTAVVYRTTVRSYKLGELDLRRKKKSRRWYSEAHNQTTTTPSPTKDKEVEVEVHQLYAPLHATLGTKVSPFRHR